MADGISFRRRDLFRLRAYWFHLARLVLGHNRFLRQRYSAYTLGVAVADAATECLVERRFASRFPLSAAEREFLEGFGDLGARIIAGPALETGADFVGYRIAECHILPTGEGILHAPSGKLLLFPDRRIDHNLVRPHHYKQEKRIRKPAVSLLETPSSHRHYFHFLLDFLPRMLRLMADVPAAREAVLLVHDELAPFQRVAVDHLKACYPGLEVIAIGRDEKVICDELILGRMLRDRLIQYFADPESLTAVRELYQHRYGIERQPMRRRLFLSRAGQRNRRLVNEAALWEILKPLGFERITPEKLPHEVQVRLFTEAACVVGATGAALTNLLFCQAGCAVVEIRPSSFNDPLYVGLCLALGLRHHALEGSAAGRRHNFTADGARLGDLIGAVIGNQDIPAPAGAAASSPPSPA